MTEKKNKLPALQGLRGLAILAIMVSHANVLSDAAGNNMLGSLGGFGVECFLLLTGYLTCYWHIEKGIAAGTLRDKVAYAWKKLRRYYPLHIVTLFIALPFTAKALYNGNLTDWGSLLLNLLLMQDWVPAGRVYFSYNSVSWYLSLQLFLLIMMPWTLRILKKIPYRFLGTLMAAVMIIQWLAAYLVTGRMPTQIAHWLVYVLPVVRWLDFLLGGLLYRLLHDSEQMRGSFVGKAMAWMSILGVIPIALSAGGGHSEVYATTVWTVPCLSILRYLLIEHDHVARIFSSAPMVWLGNISFELFMIHQLVIRYVELMGRKLLGIPSLNAVSSIFAILLAIIIARVVYRRNHVG